MLRVHPGRLALALAGRRRSFVDNRHGIAFLRKHLGARRIEHSPIPLSIIATDLATGRPFILQSGDVVSAVVASSAFPGVFPPVELDGHILIDGGVVADVPLDVAADLGMASAIVIAVPPRADARAAASGCGRAPFVDVGRRGSRSRGCRSPTGWFASRRDTDPTVGGHDVRCWIRDHDDRGRQAVHRTLAALRADGSRLDPQRYSVTMADATGDNSFRRAARAISTTSWTTKAKQAAASLKAQHAAGRAGDDSPAEPIWPTPKEQLDALKGLFNTKPAATGTPSSDIPSDVVDDATLENDAAEVADAMRRVDWAQVKVVTTERTTDVARTMRSLADNVDWNKVQPVAAQVSSALIAAVAAGRIPVGGSLGPMVARAITDQNNLGRRIAADLAKSPSAVPPDFRDAIDTTAHES